MNERKTKKEVQEFWEMTQMLEKEGKEEGMELRSIKNVPLE